MIKSEFKGKLEDVYEFFKDKYGLLMAGKDLRYTTENLPATYLLGKLNKFVETIENTLFFFDKSSNKSSLLVAVKRNQKKDSIIYYGVALRQKNEDNFELYIDTHLEAKRKGIIKGLTEDSSLFFKILSAIGIVALIVVLFAMPFLMIVVVIFSVITWPISYLIKKRKFNEKQKIMQTLVDLFQNQFELVEQTKTKDWISFFGRVKSEVEDMIVP